MANYLIIGGDGKEYGPVTDADVRHWIAEGRLNAQSQAKSESDAEFRALAQFPEFATAFASSAAPATMAPLASSSDFLEHDYELDLGGCISRGWTLVKDNMGLLFVGSLLYLLIEGVIGGLANIPLIGPMFSIANFVCSGPLIGGLFYLFIRVNRGEPAEVGEIFSGFRRAFGQLFLGVLVPGLLIGLCMIPFIILLIIKCVPLLAQLQHLKNGSTPDQATIDVLKSIAFSTLPVAFICAIPATYLSVCWKFTLPLIVDQQMDFAAAMRASWKMVNKHWWMVFGLVFLISLLNLAGICACCVGVLFSIPVGLAALMIAYETIFGAKKTSRAKARNAALLNQLGTPGLGSVMAGRWAAGIGQLVLSVAGFVLIMVWFVQMLMRYYGQMFGDSTKHNPASLTNLMVGGGLFALAWAWSLVTSFSLFREASKVSLESLETFAAGQVKMEPAKIILALSALPDWKRNGEVISRVYQFKDFPAAMKFVNHVAELAEQAQHHPDVDIRWNKVTLALTTHDAGGLTEKDFALAGQCDALSLQ